MGAEPLLTPPFTEPFAKIPYRQATWPSAARKVYACLMYYCYRWKIKDGRITITDRMGAQWCSMYFQGQRYGSTGIRCWQKGLEQLEDLGVISRDRQFGGRAITINVKHPEPQPKAPPRPKPKPAAAKAPPQAQVPQPPTRPAPVPPGAAETTEDATPDPETQAFWADFHARQSRAQGRPKPKLTAAQAEAEMERRRAAARAKYGTDHDLPGTPPAPSAP